MITFITYLQAVALISLVWWIILFIGFLIGYKAEVNISQYFQTMFSSFRRSELRSFWKSIILAFEYILGIYALIIVKGAWYPAKGIRWTISKILFSNRKERRIEREQYKDKAEDN